MAIKKSKGSVAFNVVNHTLLILLSFVMIYPFLYVFSLSVSDIASVEENLVLLYPKGFDIRPYVIVFNNSDILLAFSNSAIYTILGTFICVLFCSVTAYPLSRKYLRGKATITFIFTLTMFIQGGMIASFLLINNLGMMNTMWALIIPPIANMWYIILLRTNFQIIPDSLIESAYIDGANEWKILFKIVLPLSKAILATIILFSAVARWNDFFGPLLYLNERSKYPISVILREVTIAMSSTADFFIQNKGGSYDDTFNLIRQPGMQEKLRMAMIIVTVAPIALAYPFIQKYLVKGAMVGSIKE
jgi:putative aldouronate transport system permease protein